MCRLVLYNEKRDLYVIDILVDADLIYVFWFHGSLIWLLSMLLLILLLLDLLAYVTESVWMTFKYDFIPNVNFAILTTDSATLAVDKMMD